MEELKELTINNLTYAIPSSIFDEIKSCYDEAGESSAELLIKLDYEDSVYISTPITFYMEPVYDFEKNTTYIHSWIYVDGIKKTIEYNDYATLSSVLSLDGFIQVCITFTRRTLKEKYRYLNTNHEFVDGINHDQKFEQEIEGGREEYERLIRERDSNE